MTPGLQYHKLYVPIFLKAGNFSVKDVFSSVQNHPDHARLQPGGLFCRSSDVKNVLVGYGWNTATLRLQENIKKESYAALMDTLRVHHTAEFFPLVCGYTGAVAVSTWTSLKDCLKLDPRAQFNCH